MSDQEINYSRRRLLTAVTAAVGGVATIAAATPFVKSMLPSQKARAAGAPVLVDLSKLEPGMKLDVEWQGKVVWVINRTQQMLDNIPKLKDKVSDPSSEVPQQPDYCKNEFRAIKKEIFVAVGLCTHLGCSPGFRSEIAPADLGPEWLGGFFCPCHGSKFDLAGHVFKSVPAPVNLKIPPHMYVSDTQILIGEDKATKGA
jgi:ubiquinol-cytochrome c reductase iron-sulfur subunit